MKRRKFGVGVKKLLDIEDEEFIVRFIEEISIVYGRRYDIVFYSYYRITKCYFLLLVNYNLYRCGKKLIKSVIIVFNRSRLKNINFRVVKVYCGKFFFCFKKFFKKIEIELGLVFYY